MRLEPGGFLAHYGLVETVSAGGMGEVWRGGDASARYLDVVLGFAQSSNGD